jgi:hypothetical protein
MMSGFANHLCRIGAASRKLKPEDPGWDVPWIGMDSSQLSKTILYVSLVVLPCIAAILLSSEL